MKNIKSGKIILILLALYFILLVPALVEPISYGDECIYLTLGNAFRQGMVFYRDIHDNKPPLLYFLAALSFGSLFWFRLMAILNNLLLFFLVLKLIDKIVSRKWFLFIAGIPFIILSIFFEARIANGEIFMMTPAVLAVFLVFDRQNDFRFSSGCLVGFLFSLAFLFKVPVFFDLISITLALFIWPMAKLGKSDIGKVIANKKLWGIIFGFTFPILASLAYYASKGAFIPYLRSALLQNIGYLSSWGNTNSSLLLRTLILLPITIVIFLVRKKIESLFLFFFTWFVFSLFGALLSGRPYPHYLIEVLPSFIFLFAATLNLFSQPTKKGSVKVINLLPFFFSLMLFTFAIISYQFWYYPQISYYRNYLLFATGKITQDQFLSFWGSSLSKQIRLGKFINETVSAKEKIFVWGDAACIYAISQRVPATKYTVNYHIYDFNGYEQVLKDLYAKLPRLVVKMVGEKDWPQLDVLLSRYYYQIYPESVEDQIYIRKQTFVTPE